MGGARFAGFLVQRVIKMVVMVFAIIVANFLLVHAAPGDPASVTSALRAAQRVYLHVDLDVLNPGEFAGLNYPEPGGLTIDQLVAGIRALADFEVIGAGITECVGTGPQLRLLEPVIDAIGELLKPA